MVKSTGRYAGATWKRKGKDRVSGDQSIEFGSERHREVGNLKVVSVQSVGRSLLGSCVLRKREAFAELAAYFQLFHVGHNPPGQWRVSYKRSHLRNPPPSPSSPFSPARQLYCFSLLAEFSVLHILPGMFISKSF